MGTDLIMVSDQVIPRWYSSATLWMGVACLVVFGFLSFFSEGYISRRAVGVVQYFMFYPLLIASTVVAVLYIVKLSKRGMLNIASVLRATPALVIAAYMLYLWIGFVMFLMTEDGI